jgi:ubiquinone/menaquinone biosynthesis C-methylase UbiE
MRVQPGHTVLDVGCGPGTDTVPLADLVGPTGRVCGVDQDAAVIRMAYEAAATAAASEWVRHRQADAAALPFDTGFFDGCRSERLFQHLPDPVPALAEMVRTARPGGWIAVLDTDWASGSVDTVETEIERRLVRFNVDHRFHNGYAARQPYRLFKQTGLSEVSAQVLPQSITSYALARQLWLLDDMTSDALVAGAIDDDELQRFTADLEAADARGTFFGYGCMLLAAGRRPG